MEAWGFGLTVLGLAVEALALVWLALGIRKRSRPHTVPGKAEGRFDLRVGGSPIDQLRAELEEVKATVQRLQPAVSTLKVGIRRLALGDVRSDWIGLALAAAGVALALVGTVLVQLAGSPASC